MKKFFSWMLVSSFIILVSCNPIASTDAQEYKVPSIEENEYEKTLLPEIDSQEDIIDQIQRKEELTLINQTGKTYQTVSIQENLAYVGAGDCLLVLDISNPLEISAVGNLCGLPSVIKRIALTNDYAYIVDGESLHIIDISNSQKLIEVGSLDTNGSAESISVSGDYVYLADGIEGLRIIDVSQPAEPQEINYIENIHAIDVIVHENYVFIVDDGKVYLRIFNISDPTETIEVASFETIADGSVDIMQYRMPTFHIAISGGYAYVVDGLKDLHIFDISDMSNIKQPKILYMEENIISVAAAENLVCIIMESNNIYMTEKNKLQILDVTDLQSPQELGGFEIQGNPKSVVINNNHLFVAGQGSGIVVVDISEPEILETVAYYSELPTEFGISTKEVFDVAVNDGYLYILDENNLIVMDIIDPENSKQVSSLNLPGNARVLGVQGSYAYVMTAEARFLVIDISNPGEPNIVGTMNVSYYPYHSAFDIKENYVYASGQISEGVYELDIIDVSDPAKPEIVYSYSYDVVDSILWGISVKDEFIYMIGFHCFLILDISDPMSPLEIFSDNTISGKAISVVDNYAYMAASDGLHVFDVADPKNPELIIFKGFGNLSTINISGDYAFLSGQWEGFKVINITEPTDPSEVAFCDTSEYPHYIIGSDKYIYVAVIQEGLLTFRFSLE